MTKKRKKKRSKPARKTTKSPDYNAKMRGYIRAAIRRIWGLYSKEKIAVKAQAKRYRKRYKNDGTESKVAAVFYICAGCKGEFPEKEVAVDHIESIGATPAFPPDGISSWDQWLFRVFTSENNLQVLCTDCHRVKTKIDKASKR